MEGEKHKRRKRRRGGEGVGKGKVVGNGLKGSIYTTHKHSRDGAGSGAQVFKDTQIHVLDEKTNI